MDSVVSHETDHHDPATRNITRKELFLACIGSHEFLSPEMWRAAITELIATACLIFTLTSCIISCLNSHDAEPKLLVPFAVFIIAFLHLMVTVPLSGGHMSPVFTFIAALKGIITIARATIYVLAQCLGSIISFVIIGWVMSQNAAHKYSYGGCIIGGNGETTGINAESAFILEFACTFVVLFVGVTLAFDKRRCEELGLAMVCSVVAGAMAVAVFVSITVTGQAGYSGVGLNPARCLGAALLHGGPLWEGHWVFWVGPFIACIVYYAYTKTLPRKGLVMDSSGYDFINLARACSSGTRNLGYSATGIFSHLQEKSIEMNTHT